LAQNPRILMQLKNAKRLSAEQREAIALQAHHYKEHTP
jgi:hypothetical protein